jgi:hypothetical protein
MKVLTLTQPWASLLFVPDLRLRKRMETRSWFTNYTGTIGIHAGKGLGGMSKHEFVRLCKSEPFATALQAMGYKRASDLPRGCIIGTVDIVQMFHTEEMDGIISNVERAFGDYSDGRWAWDLTRPRRWETPIPTRGALGLWEWNEVAV